MIICPNCKEEIEEDSYFCDQCGQPLLFCEHCGRVGKGHRCTYCGGMMLCSDKQRANIARTETNSWRSSSMSNPTLVSVSKREIDTIQSQMPEGIPQLSLYNGMLNIRIIGYNGAIIGRRQGTYKQLFEKNMYVSGVHAQLMYNAKTGWCIVDKHSSNGTKINQRAIQPDIPMDLHNGDILSIANVNLQVVIK
jgi:hypothetical protein